MGLRVMRQPFTRVPARLNASKSFDGAGHRRAAKGGLDRRRRLREIEGLARNQADARQALQDRVVVRVRRVLLGELGEEREERADRDASAS